LLVQAESESAQQSAAALKINFFILSDP